MKSQTISPYVLASGGNYLLNSNFSNSFTIGEMTAVETVNGNSFFLTQGFQQCNPIISTGIDHDKISEISVYPNPSTGKFHIQTGGYHIQQIELFSISGEKITTNYFSQNEFSGLDVDLSNLSNGIYFLKIQSNSNEQSNQIILPLTLLH